jgi:hypothetical protein
MQVPAGVVSEARRSGEREPGRRAPTSGNWPAAMSLSRTVHRTNVLVLIRRDVVGLLVVAMVVVTMLVVTTEITATPWPARFRHPTWSRRDRAGHDRPAVLVSAAYQPRSSPGCQIDEYRGKTLHATTR